MSNINMPGFTAEHSLQRNGAHFHTGAPGASPVFGSEVIPQLRCQLHGSNLTCSDEPFSLPPNFGGDLSEAKCRAQCFRTKRGAPLKKCLAEC
jgi:hypothetical protein